VPRRAESLGLALKHAHGRYASYWNATHQSSGHVWQGRYYSCPLDEPHLWEALRYTELNPVRAGLVAESESWMWSSAAVHCARVPDSGWLAREMWQSRWTADSWRAFLKAKESASELAAIRLSTHTGRQLGTAELVHALERSTQRPPWRRKSVAGDQGPSLTQDRASYLLIPSGTLSKEAQGRSLGIRGNSVRPRKGPAKRYLLDATMIIQDQPQVSTQFPPRGGVSSLNPMRSMAVFSSPSARLWMEGSDAARPPLKRRPGRCSNALCGALSP
jgi:putative transposase